MGDQRGKSACRVFVHHVHTDYRVHTDTPRVSYPLELQLQYLRWELGPKPGPLQSSVPFNC